MVGILSHFNQKFTLQGTLYTTQFCTDRKASECITTVLMTVFTQRNFVADCLQVQDGRFAFLKNILFLMNIVHCL